MGIVPRIELGESAPVQGLLTLAQLGRRAREADTVEGLGFVMVNETLSLLPYRQAGFWVATGLPRLAAVSGLPQPDPNAPYVQWLSRLCRGLQRQHDEIVTVDAATAPVAAAAEWSDWLPAHGVWVPLRRPGGGPVNGGLLLARDTPWQPHDVALLAELSHVYGHALAAFQPRRAPLERMKSLLRPGRAKTWALVAVVGLCLLPVRLTVLAPAEVVPSDPFLVRAPFEGVVDRFHVRPNQTVEAGTPLLDLDTTALQVRHALAQRAYETANAEYRQSAQLAVTDDKSKLEMALRRGELESRALELRYTADQLERVRIKADRAGVVVFADANDWLGKTVVTGEKIMLLADPQQVELTARMPVGDQIELTPGAKLTLYPDVSPTTAYEAEVITVAYRAETSEDGILAYRIRAEFDSATAPRLGLTGTARIYGERVPLIYFALRRPLTAARQWLGW